MASGLPGSVTDRVRPIVATIRATSMPLSGPKKAEGPPARPFITISQQAGTGAWTLAERLSDRLNAAGAEGPRWSSWDRELVEKVAADHHIATQLIESLEESAHSWLSDLFAGLSSADEPDVADEMRVYHKVAATIRALAQVGHVVVVGRGGVLITRNMAGGIHVRLIAPLEHRVATLAMQTGRRQDEARAMVQQLDHNREMFYRRYWPGTAITDEVFAVTLNSAVLSEEQMIECIVPLATVKARR